MSIIIRTAVAADIPQIYDIWYANEVGDDPDPPPRGTPTVIEHELATGQIVVAERAGRLAGFATLIVRGGVAFLADLFCACRGAIWRCRQAAARPAAAWRKPDLLHPQLDGSPRAGAVYSRGDAPAVAQLLSARAQARRSLEAT